MDSEITITEQEWKMYDDYKEIIDIANTNSKFKLNENPTYINKLSQMERGVNLYYDVTHPELINLLKKEIKSVIKKLIALKPFRKNIEQLESILPLIDDNKTSKQFYEVILKIKSICDILVPKDNYKIDRQYFDQMRK